MKLDKTTLMIGAAVAGVGLLWLLTRKGVASGVATAIVTTAADATAGAVVGAGEVIGIPQTDLTQCQMDINNGDWWAASFSCPMPVYLAAVKNRVLN